jgi:SAM-dependent methyltransferase
VFIIYWLKFKLVETGIRGQPKEVDEIVKTSMNIKKTIGNSQELPTGSLFDEISDLWEEIAEANSTKRQINFVLNKIENKGQVLDLACGNGRHSIRLRKKGYNVIGLDSSRRLLEKGKFKASQESLNFPVVLGDVRFIPFRSDVFSAVISMDASLGYLRSESEDLQSLREVCRILGNKGAFLVDLFNGNRLEQRYGKKSFLNSLGNVFSQIARFRYLNAFFRWREYPSFFLLQRRYVNNEKKLIETWFFRNKKTNQITIYRHIIRLYNLQLLQNILKNAGLDQIKTFGNYEGQEHNQESARLIVIAQKL